MKNEFQTIQEAKAKFPSSAEPVDENFLEQFKEPIGELKEVFEDKGGIHKITVGDYSMICRVPAREHIEQSVKGSNKDGYQSDMELLGYCLLYPTIGEVEKWVKSGKPGLVGRAVKKLMEIGYIFQEADAKKL